MYKTATFTFAGANIGLVWLSESFAEFKKLGLKKFGVYTDESKTTHVTDSASYNYQAAACLFEYLSPLNMPEFIIDGEEACEAIEKKIILEYVPSKMRNEHARQRRIFFKDLISESCTSAEQVEAYTKVLAMLEELIPTL